MPSHILLVILLEASMPGASSAMATLDRATPVQADCVGKKRVLTAPARAKRSEPRRRCHVLAPILM
jgi:hypothetical protein